MHVSKVEGTTTGNILELQGRDVGWEPGHHAGHLPWSQGITRSPHGTAVAEAVVLLQSPDWIRG